MCFHLSFFNNEWQWVTAIGVQQVIQYNKYPCIVLVCVQVSVLTIEKFNREGYTAHASCCVMGLGNVAQEMCVCTPSSYCIFYSICEGKYTVTYTSVVPMVIAGETILKSSWLAAVKNAFFSYFPCIAALMGPTGAIKNVINCCYLCWKWVQEACVQNNMPIIKMFLKCPFQNKKIETFINLRYFIFTVMCNTWRESSLNNQQPYLIITFIISITF